MGTKVGVRAHGSLNGHKPFARPPMRRHRGGRAHAVRGFLAEEIPVGRLQVPLHVCIYACMYVCTYVGMYICIYVSLYVCMYICTVWVGVHRQIQPHTCETAASSISTNKTHAHKHTLSTHSYRIHVQIYPLAGPVVTAPESLFLNSCPSSALVLTPLAGGTSLAPDISTS